MSEKKKSRKNRKKKIRTDTLFLPFLALRYLLLLPAPAEKVPFFFYRSLSCVFLPDTRTQARMEYNVRL